MGGACLPASGRDDAAAAGAGRRAAAGVPAALLRWNAAADRKPPHGAAFLIGVGAEPPQRARVGCGAVVAQLLPRGAAPPGARGAFAAYFAAAAAQRERRVGENPPARRRGARG
ncbi:uncharacterized protein Tco025E_08669 [Trypanosoma conorhini]|uniref:Uncharacterized protein n=1 Tax=Trypanosoma conorhini TaxID=83891 RepID=A0A422N6L2_9TRYP|nr:uncharacterized protein Tco025E_08669 [Trypanosoma conorhini]RNF01100.1 hypothetical protein Tco025E_08669 [Trypanosoma conorhini]